MQLECSHPARPASDRVLHAYPSYSRLGNGEAIIGHSGMQEKKST